MHTYPLFRALVYDGKIIYNIYVYVENPQNFGGFFGKKTVVEVCLFTKKNIDKFGFL